MKRFESGKYGWGGISRAEAERIDGFKNEVKKGIYGFTNKQLVDFAYLCAIRALPFLSAKRKFAIWQGQEASKRSKLRYIFNAIDFNRVYVNDKLRINPTVTSTTFKNAVSNARKAAERITDEEPPEAICAARASRAAVQVASALFEMDALKAKADDASNTITSGVSIHDYVTRQLLTTDIKRAETNVPKLKEVAISAVLDAAAYAFCAYAHNTKGENKLERILLNDLRVVRHEPNGEIDAELSMYTEVLGHFLEDLSDLGYTYWSALFDSLFKNKLQYDNDKLEWRISILYEMKKYGSKKDDEYLAFTNHILEETMKHINDFSDAQKSHFSYICIVRLLPFLCIENDLFGRWKADSRLPNLFAIFNAIDICASFHCIDSDIEITDEVILESSEKLKVCFTSAGSLVTPATNGIVFILQAALRKDCVETYNKTMRLISILCGSLRVTGGGKLDYNFKQTLLEDACAIMESRLNDFSNDTYDIYGELWGNFTGMLRSVGCGYWAMLYEDLVSNRFALKQTALKHRLNIPSEMKKLGAAEIGQYLRRLSIFEENSERLDESRIIILGEKGAGKTSLARRLIGNSAPLLEQPEVADDVNIGIWEVQRAKDRGRDMHIHVWDFIGQSITHSAHRFFTSPRCLYIYVFNGRIENSNESRYWLDQIMLLGKRSPVLFLINHEGDGGYTELDRVALKREYPFIVDFLELNIGSDDYLGIEHVRQKIIEEVQGNPKLYNHIGSDYHSRIKTKLTDRFKEVTHISYEDFKKLAVDCDTPEMYVDDILQDLHDIGICLWHVKIEQLKKYVINPDLVVDGVNKIINEGREIYKQEHSFALTVESGQRILGHNYTADRVAFLFKLMSLYELAYVKDEDSNRIFVPLILPLGEPEKLLNVFDKTDVLTMRFDVERRLPPNIVAQLIVRKNGDVYDEGMLWRRGAVLMERNETFAVIRESERSITVDVVGEERTRYVASLREAMCAIFGAYDGVSYDIKYMMLVPDETKLIANEFLLVSEDEIRAGVNMAHSHRTQSTDIQIRLPRTDIQVSPYPTIMAYGIELDTEQGTY